MPEKPPTYRPPSMPSRIEVARSHDATRRQRHPWRAWYSLAIWCHPKHGLRALQLKRQPWCQTCLRSGRHTPATVAHHIRDHDGDWQLFVDPANHESACKRCHDRELQARRFRQGAGGVKS
jgi:5-methylcytosine-specific restriction protein A